MTAPAPPAAPAIIRAADTTPGTDAARPWAVRMRGIGKRYRLGELKSLNENFREDLVNWTRGLLSGGARAGNKDDFWAMRDIDLDVDRGDTVGIIGRNGAGKSTLLKILSRITQPTTGELRYRGRLASLLEVGTGFHRELTGRENIYLNGAILGMTRREIAAAFDAIVDFAGVEKFLDTPVKRYSSGMYVRLAFAVAAHLRTDILVVDEVLAVGDAEFQKKCLGKMQDVAHDGRTVFFVSHNMGAVQNLCNRGVVLRDGAVDYMGDVGISITHYMDMHSTSDATRAEFSPVEQGDKVLKSICMGSTQGETSLYPMGSMMCFQISMRVPKTTEPRVGIGISDMHGKRLTSLSTSFQDDVFALCVPGEIVELQCRIPVLHLNHGQHFVTLVYNDGVISEAYQDVLSFQVVASDIFRTGRVPTGPQAVYIEESEWKLTRQVQP